MTVVRVTVSVCYDVFCEGDCVRAGAYKGKERVTNRNIGA